MHFSAEALYWQIREGSADNWTQEITPAGTTRSATLYSVPFKWSPGFRLGVGRNTNYDNWDVAFFYTFFRTNARSQASVTSGGLYSPYLGNFYVNNTAGASFGANYRNASIEWKVFYNTFDLELGRKFKIDELLELRSFIGIKSAIINQDINTNWNNPNNAVNFTNATEDLKSDFWGIGPAIGLDSSWAIYKAPKNTISIIGNLSGALLWGHWNFQDVYQNNIPLTVTINTSNINGASTMARGLLGIEWSGDIYKTSVHVRVGYEAQIWFSHIQYYCLDMGRLNNLMSLQGAILGLNIDF